MTLQTPNYNFGKDEYVVDMTEHEPQYWQGTESGLLGEFEFQGTYTTGDGSSDTVSLVVAPDVRSSGGVGLMSDVWRQPLVSAHFFLNFFYFFKKMKKTHFFPLENRATRRQRRPSIGLPYTTGGIHRQNKHDRLTDSMGRHFWWRFRCSMSSGHHERGFLDPRTPWADVWDVSDFDNPPTCSHSDNSGGVAAFVPPRTPRISGYDFLCTCGLCCYMLHVYCMLYVCYMSSSEPSSGSSGSVWIYRRVIFGKQNCLWVWTSCTMYRRTIFGEQNGSCSWTSSP